MYGQVSARSRELGALRAIGFKRRAILASILAESVLMALIAGALGVLAALPLSLTSFRLTTVQTLSEITYRFHANASVVLTGLVLAALLGYAGGLLPALRMARMRIVDAVRAD